MNVLNDVTAAPFLVSFLQLAAEKKATVTQFSLVTGFFVRMRENILHIFRAQNFTY